MKITGDFFFFTDSSSIDENRNSSLNDHQLTKKNERDLDVHTMSNRRKIKTLNNNNIYEYENSKKGENRKRLTTSDGNAKYKIDRLNVKNVPKVIGFQDINFIDFSSQKFPLIAKNICEESIHLSKDDFSFDCPHCERAFPCDSALEIHVQTCENNDKKIFPKLEKKNKRKSTPKFHPQHSTESDSDDCLENMELNVTELQRKAFFNSLDLRNTEKCDNNNDDDTDSNKKSAKSDSKTDLADIQSILSVTNIPGIKVRDFSTVKENKIETNDKLSEIISSRSSPDNNYTNMTVNSSSSSSTNYNVFVSTNYSGGDQVEEEAQDCFAAECRRMKLRGEFPCKLCTAIFPNLRALKGHNRVHISVANGTPNSPYRCNICTYNSLDKATLVRHMRSHNGDRPYECAMCNYAFTTKANCERHLRNRHSKITRDEVKSSIIYHPSEDPINDSEYQKTNEMNKKNLEKSKEKQEFSLPINLKINLSNLKKTSKNEEDLFETEHRELIKNEKQINKEKMAAEYNEEQCKAWQYDVSDEALDLSLYNEKNYESDSSDLPQDLSKKEEIKEFNNNVEEKCSKANSDFYTERIYDNKNTTNFDINNLIKMYSCMYPSLNIAQIQQILLTQLNFPGILQKFHNFPFSPFLVSSPLFSNSNNYMQKSPQKDVSGLQMSGGNILDEKNHNLSMSEKLQLFQQQAIAELLFKKEKDRIANEYFGKTPSRLNENTDKHRRLNTLRKQNEFLSEAEKKNFGDILLNKKDDKKESLKLGNIEKSSADSRNSSVKMVIKNGVLIPKQKQRRYRTERPFSCGHCSARFTLRSNMERHIKQQHPQYWTQKPRSNVGNLKKTESNLIKLNSYEVDRCRNFDRSSSSENDYLKHYAITKSLTLVPRENFNGSEEEKKWEEIIKHKKEYESSNDVLNLVKDDDNEVKIKQEIIKTEIENRIEEDEETKDDLIISEDKEEEDVKMNQNFVSNDESSPEFVSTSPDKTDADTKIPDEEMKEENERKESQPQDLASVSKMLDNAVTQTQAFQKYFQEGSKKDEDSIRMDAIVKREEGEDRSEEEEGLIAENTSSDENR